MAQTLRGIFLFAPTWGALGRDMSILITGVVRSLAATYRFRWEGQPGVRGPAGHEHCLLAIWHQNLFAGILAQTGRRHVVIVSRSGDGNPVTHLCESLGHTVARGSSRSKGRDKGGQAAKLAMIEALRSGLPGAVTVDGPRGPIYQVKPGIIDMARQTGLPIIPYLPMPRQYWSFSSWDRFRLPYPFTRIDVHYGEPIFVPESATDVQLAEYQERVRVALQDLQLMVSQSHQPAPRRA